MTSQGQPDSNDPLFRVRANAEDPSLLDHLAISMTSCNPPLQDEARAQINLIISSCLKGLTGAEQLEADRLFDALSYMPPLAGKGFKVALQELSAMGIITRKSVMDYIGARRNPTRSVYDNDGFVEGDGKLSRLGDNPNAVLDEKHVKVSYDAKSAVEEAGRVWAQVLGRLTRFTDLATQRDLVSDCCSILDLRLRLDLSATPTAE